MKQTDNNQAGMPNNMRSKHFCEECKDLPEGEVVAGHDHTNDYDIFVRQARSAGFLDDQIDFLADWMSISDGHTK